MTAVRTPELEEMTALIAEAQRRHLPVPPELEREIYLREMSRRGLNPWETFRDYVEYINPTLFKFEHINTLVDTAEKVVDTNEIDRLIVLLAPRYFKTEVFGRLLCSYHMRKYPGKLVGLSSYSASKAWEVSENAREYFEQSGGILRPSAAAKKFWGPPEGGELWAVGTAEGVIGRGMHLGICDDPVDPEMVRSSVYQRKFQRWWPSKWLQRQEPGAKLILVMQRLGTDDPVDFLFRREIGENTELAPEYWHVLVMDEIKSDEPLGRWRGEQGLPPTCTLIKDNRKRGEILAKSRFNAQEVEKLQRTAGPLECATQRQQRPMRPTGDFWRKNWFTIYDALPAGAYNGGRDWDTAYTKEEANSASAFVRSFRGVGDGDNFPIYIEECGWDWHEFPALVKWMAELGGPHYVEEKASGKSVIQTLGVYNIVA
ncbi:hypothetical protein LCGC14_2178070, partial [marine sediment metagenome]